VWWVLDDGHKLKDQVLAVVGAYVDRRTQVKRALVIC
jgi:hypothetical protein